MWKFSNTDQSQQLLHLGNNNVTCGLTMIIQSSLEKVTQLNHRTSYLQCFLFFFCFFHLHTPLLLKHLLCQFLVRPIKFYYILDGKDMRECPLCIRIKLGTKLLCRLKSRLLVVARFMQLNIFLDEQVPHEGMISWKKHNKHWELITLETTLVVWLHYVVIPLSVAVVKHWPFYQLDKKKKYNSTRWS